MNVARNAPGWTSLALLSSLIAGCTGGSSPPSGSDQVLTLSANGSAVDLSSLARATQTTTPYFTRLEGYDTTDVSNVKRSITVELGAYPPVVGTYSCGADGVDVLYTDSHHTWVAGVNAHGTQADPNAPTSCAISVTAFTAAGSAMEGTFTGSLQPDSATDPVLSVTDGYFKLTAP